MTRNIQRLMAERLAQREAEAKGVKEKRALRKQARKFRQLAKATDKRRQVT